jgi:Mn2+/Fe2+ NRAMP family transporter
MKDQKSPPPNNNKLLLRYAGLGMQMLVSLALAIFAGLKVDEWLSFSTPLLVWILPLLVIVIMIYQVIKDTSKK